VYSTHLLRTRRLQAHERLSRAGVTPSCNHQSRWTTTSIVRVAAATRDMLLTLPARPHFGRRSCHDTGMRCDAVYPSAALLGRQRLPRNPAGDAGALDAGALLLDLSFEDDLDAAVVGTPLAGGVVGDRAAFAHPFGLQASGRVASAHQVVTHGVRTAL